MLLGTLLMQVDRRPPTHHHLNRKQVQHLQEDNLKAA